MKVFLKIHHFGVKLKKYSVKAFKNRAKIQRKSVKTFQKQACERWITQGKRILQIGSVSECEKERQSIRNQNGRRVEKGKRMLLLYSGVMN